MTTITETGIDLSWVTFSDDGDDQICDVRNPECANEAVAVAHWEMTCTCRDCVWLLCVEHRDLLEGFCLVVGRRFRCPDCAAWITLLRIEPLR